MRSLLTLLLLLTNLIVIAQKDESEVMMRMKRFHELMVQKEPSVEQYIDDSLSYGHSNGWVENKADFLSDLEKRIDYHSIKEDSITVRVNGKVANVRFAGVYDSTLDGKRNEIRLKVLEVWVKTKKGWKLFARQAIRT
jgi:hypothetical protein